MVYRRPARLECGRKLILSLLVLINLSACALFSGQLMVARRHAFEREFIPTLDQYPKFADAADVYVANVRRIANEVGWRLTDLDELGLLYVQAMSEYVDRGELTRADALFRMRLMEKMIMDEYRRQAFDAMTLWALWQSSLTAQRLREPVTCFRADALITCR